MRYRLDELGWYQFEALVIALLKADLGIGVEAWSQHAGDRGRDAYSEGPLPFPSNRPTDGPFVFQIKFSSSIDRAASLRSAVQREIKSVDKRRRKDTWIEPKHYCLITNVDLSPQLRDAITALLSTALPQTAVHLLGGGDACAALDRHPQIRRSFPQLLGLADLTALIDEAVTRDVRERSQSAIAIAEQYVRTFVPTEAYEKAWSVLKEHSFAVLCGPPEMGKTTIAWMVALSQVATGWQGVVCKTPEDCFKAYSVDRSQVFVADDAFGRTEYDPALVLDWERELHLLLPKLDSRHWLIWTSRKHLLERAIQKMDLQASAAKFPNPGSVLVEARRLLDKEKALILYRHAKCHLQQERDREVVRTYALNVVRHPAFTPERIRHFVDWLPEAGVSQLDPEVVAGKIAEIIENPTSRMRKAYEALPAAHKWVLVALLEQQYGQASRQDLETRYALHCPADVKESFDRVIDQLVDAFLFQIGPDDKGELKYSWIHPSYRDLVIEELSSEDAMKKTFISSTDVSGIKLAISSLGGALGARRLPLLRDAKDWSLFTTQMNRLVATSHPWVATALLNQVSDSIELESKPEVRKNLIATLASLCESVRGVWDQKGVILAARDLEAYSTASKWLSRIPPVPDIAPSWSSHLEKCRDQAASTSNGDPFDPDSLSGFVDFVVAVRHSEPRWLAKVGFPDSFGTFFGQIDLGMRNEIDADPDLNDDDDIEGRASQLDDLSSSLAKLAHAAGPVYGGLFREIGGRLSSKASLLRESLPEEPPDDDDDNYRQGHSPGDLDIRTMFSDL